MADRMESGDRIRVMKYVWGNPAGTEDYTVEEFRFCLGIFMSNDHRRAGEFTPLCALYEPGPDSESDYIPNHGEYTTNLVQAWMDICQ